MIRVLTIVFLNLLIGTASLCAQTIKTGNGKVNNENFSYSYIEPAQDIKGILILLPGWGESTKSIFEKTKLPSLLLEKGFVTIVPQLHQTLFADDFTIAELNEITRIQSERYHSDHLHLIVGGLSAGGAIAIGYAEHVLSLDTAHHLKAVFAIDPPLDLTRMYRSAENKINYDCKNKLIKKEGDFIKKYLLGALKGTPEDNPENYAKHSAFLATAADGGNAKFLKNIPVRLYSEPDIDFVRNKYCDKLQFDDINAFDLEKLNTFLSGINKGAEYITTKGKGFHTWNILEPNDCADWILRVEN
ncbi:alpha/beta fold hydrolase [Pinibacter aurantiacus]|uniref:Alpha/beta hydrolase n=1 Tax=Pinibacter aurantiacus TaxID=2851599 RepID=A0A9E2SA97_9BACT|nr:hypothetical protein [Pinibacter aurantiacus]MBV4357594.1 hypothetical protein [Pinibacter aurantiacus]